MTPPADFFGSQFSKLQSDFSGWGSGLDVSTLDITGAGREVVRIHPRQGQPGGRMGDVRGCAIGQGKVITIVIMYGPRVITQDQIQNWRILL